MAWIHDSGYEPAYAHVGYPVPIQIDGSEAVDSSAPTPLEVLGWRSACECGWRGMQFYPRSEWPGATALAPDGVDGWETNSASFAEWRRHLNLVLPELAVHELVIELAVVEARLAQACREARVAGLGWSRIKQAAGSHPAVDAAHQREITYRSKPSFRGASRPARDRGAIGPEQ